MQLNMILAGVGGQGILSIAQAVSMAAMRRGWNVKQSELHGMSQRGGAVQAHLRIADGELYSDLIPHGGADIVLAVEPVEALRYVQYLSDQGQLVSNTARLSTFPITHRSSRYWNASRNSLGTCWWMPIGWPGQPAPPAPPTW